MPVYGSVIRVDNNASVLSFTTMYSTNFFRVYWSHLTKIFNSFNKPFFKKLRFKGKGYYIFKNIRQTITPQFGHSHRLYLYAYFASVIFLSKTHIFLFGFLKNDIVNLSYKIKEMRSINIFTGRGVRFSRQIIYKKTGKVSSYR
jgi:ribosomal protein L6P/L9E